MQGILSRIKEHRFSKGFTQENMASFLGISQNAYYKIENGHTKLLVATLIGISNALQVDVLELLEGMETEYVFKEYYKKRKNLN